MITPFTGDRIILNDLGFYGYHGLFNEEERLGQRFFIDLQCGDCRERNYTSTKNRRNDPQRLELRKYCSRCRSHTVHREVR